MIPATAPNGKTAAEKDFLLCSGLEWSSSEGEGGNEMKPIMTKSQLERKDVVCHNKREESHAGKAAQL